MADDHQCQQGRASASAQDHPLPARSVPRDFRSFLPPREGTRNVQPNLSPEAIGGIVKGILAKQLGETMKVITEQGRTIALLNERLDRAMAGFDPTRLGRSFRQNVPLCSSSISNAICARSSVLGGQEGVSEASSANFPE
jgi:hypothetical protein